MSNSDRKNEVKKSDLVPEKYKDVFQKDFDELIKDIEVNQHQEIKAYKAESLNRLNFI